MFGWDDAFLLSMSAAGALFNISQAKQSQKLIQQGRDLEQAAFETNFEALRTQSAESSLEAMQSLRENVSNQIAINAARGVSSGAGSAQANIQASERTFGKDEQSRRINLLSKENELRAANVLSGLHTLQSETELGQSLTSKIFNAIPVSSLIDRFGPKSSSKTNSVSKFVPKRAGFGLEPV